MALAAVVLLNMNRSTLMKKFPAPKAKRIELGGSAASGTVIDCAGGWYNDAKLTELIIRSEKIADGWSWPEGIIIRNCSIRGAIRIMGNVDVTIALKGKPAKTIAAIHRAEVIGRERVAEFLPVHHHPFLRRLVPEDFGVAVPTMPHLRPKLARVNSKYIPRLKVAQFADLIDDIE